MILLALAAFLAPILGGQLPIAQPVAPGLAGLVASMWKNTAGAGDAHFLIGLPVVVAFLIAAFGRNVLQVPQPRITALMGIFAALLLFSTLLSNYKFVSLQVVTEWLTYIAGFFGVVTLAGRTRGPKVIAIAIFAGCLVVALLGIVEYKSEIDPNWRIFSTWMQPNALGGMLLIGVFLGLGLSFTERLFSIVFAFGTVLMLWALWLTGSKGSVICVAAVLPLALLLLLNGTVVSSSAARRGLTLLCIVFYLAAAGGGLMLLKKGGGIGGGNRILNAAATSKQSVDFRVLLWKSAAQLTATNALGTGIGTFQFESSRPGIVPQTVLAHESYLQLASEASAVAPLLLVAAVGLCFFEMVLNSSKQPKKLVPLKVGVGAALLASVLNNLIDSNLYQMGTGLCFFMLLGVGLQLSADGTVPEYTPRGWRYGFGTVTLLASLYALYAGVVDVSLGRFRYDLANHDIPSAQAGASWLQSVAPFYGQIWFDTAAVATTPQEQAQWVKNAIACGATPAYYRRLANIYSRAGDDAGAEAELRKVFALDPKNLPALEQILTLQEGGNPAGATSTANLMLDIEKTDYFTNRAIPELIPTQTFAARRFLANQTEQPQARADLLRPAVEGYLDYVNSTVPRIIGSNGAYGGETVNGALAKLNSAAEMANNLHEAYERLRRPEDAKWAADASAKLGEAIATLSSASSPK